MPTLSSEQIEAKKKQLKQLADEAKAIYDELVGAGVIELSDDDLGQASGGVYHQPDLRRNSQGNP
ncbi:MAG: hypothetical protein J5486_04720 [Bacteroidaceae bacterium]|nr:hypothetical protein [Bacteroidaceae bacterium]